jgi:hypothetical protein
MENDIEKDLDLELEDESDQDSQTTDTTTEAVDYKTLYEQEKADKKKLERKFFAARAASKPLEANPKKEPLADEIIQKVHKLDLIEQKRQFGYENSLSPEETDYAFQFNGGKTPTKEVLEHPFFKAGLEGYRATKRLENNTPGTSTSGSVFQGKKFEELSTEDRSKAFTERLKSVRK